LNLLNVDNLCISFGGLKAVQNFCLDLRPGGLSGLIGPNGAGKTTVFNLLTGVYLPGEGSVKLNGTQLVGLAPWQIARAGLSRTFQNIRLFPDLTVIDNLKIAMHLRGHHTLRDTLLRTFRFQRNERKQTAHALNLLDLFNLAGRADDYARNLPYGDQRRLEILRALATDPKVILLDEPAAGMNPAEKIELAKSIRNIRDKFGLSVLLIEHDMALVMEICEQITVLDYGQIIATGTPLQVRQNPAVVKAYLGSND